MTDFMTVTQVSTVVQPTTFTSVYVSTQVIDNVRVIVTRSAAGN